MPRKPTEKVIEHRITFGQKERDLLESVSNSYSINKVATPFVALISDVSALAFLTSLYIGFKYGPSKLEWLSDKYDSVEQLAKDVSAVVESETIGKIKEGQKIKENLDEAGMEPFEALFAGTPLAPLFKVF